MGLSGELNASISRALLAQPRRGLNVDVKVKLDCSHFALLYESSILSLERLTPHQEQKLAECAAATAHLLTGCDSSEGRSENSNFPCRPTWRR